MNLTNCAFVMLLLLAAAAVDAKRMAKRSHYFDLTPDERLCAKKRCKQPKGSFCEIVEKKGKRIATCTCPTNCDDEPESPVCSVYGREYDNICLMHMEACSKKKTIRVAYKGRCIASQRRCELSERKQFPFRLMDWFVHLRQNDDFGSIDPGQTVTTISEEERRAVADWKFNIMDKNNNGVLTKRELKRFRYALMPMEHCAAEFFKYCDQDKNGKIQASEWTSCLFEDGWQWYLARERETQDEETLL